MPVDNSATAWARKLIANGADPQQIEAWMRHELALDPLAFRELMTSDEIRTVLVQQSLARVRVHLVALTEGFRRVAEAAATVTRNLNDLNGVRP